VGEHCPFKQGNITIEKFVDIPWEIPPVLFVG
jgi:hypothetical protein